MFALAVGLGLLSGSVYAACMGPYCYDDTGATIAGFPHNGTGVGLPSISTNTLASSPNYVGRLVLCNTCALIGGGTGTVACISTTTTTGYMVHVSSTATRCQ